MEAMHSSCRVKNGSYSAAAREPNVVGRRVGVNESEGEQGKCPFI